MDWKCIEGDWKHIKDKVKAQWDRLTDDHLDQIAGKRDHLVGKIQEHYGVARHDSERQVSDWEHRNQDLFAQTAAEIRKLPKSLHGSTE